MAGAGPCRSQPVPRCLAAALLPAPSAQSMCSCWCWTKRRSSSACGTGPGSPRCGCCTRFAHTCRPASPPVCLPRLPALRWCWQGCTRLCHHASTPRRTRPPNTMQAHKHIMYCLMYRLLYHLPYRPAVPRHDAQAAGGLGGHQVCAERRQHHGPRPHLAGGHDTRRGEPGCCRRWRPAWGGHMAEAAAAAAAAASGLGSPSQAPLRLPRASPGCLTTATPAPCPCHRCCRWCRWRRGGRWRSMLRARSTPWR